MISYLSSEGIKLDNSLVITDDEFDVLEQQNPSVINQFSNTVTIQISERPLTNINSPINNSSQPEVELRLLSALHSSTSRSQTSPLTAPITHLTPQTTNKISSSTILNNSISNQISVPIPTISLPFPTVTTTTQTPEILQKFLQIIANFDSAQFDFTRNFIEISELKLDFYSLLAQEIVDVDEICNILILLSLNQEEEKVSLSEMASEIQALGVRKINMKLELIQILERENRVLEGLIGVEMEKQSGIEGVLVCFLSCLASFIVFLWLKV